jgi:hypothetical protein
MGSWPLAQSLFYQYKRTMEAGGVVVGQWICSNRNHPQQAKHLDK